MRTLKLTLAYDGTDYCGWQVQPGEKTVQAEVERALHEITGEKIRVVASGRTDSGVHALGQVISFSSNTRLKPAAIKRAMNAKLPFDIRIRDAEDVPADFDAMRSPRSKRYRYVIDNGRVQDPFKRAYSWHIPVRLDVEAMARAGQRLVGRHDFKCFESKGAERATSVRTITDVTVERGRRSNEGGTEGGNGEEQPGRAGEWDETDKIYLEVEGDGFLYNMVRAITGTLYEVGRGAREESWISEVLASKDRKLAGQTAPAHGLYMLWVNYD